MYGHHGKVKQTRGNFHHYLAMHFNFSHRGQVRIHMKDYIESMLNDFPIQFTSEDSAPTPALRTTPPALPRSCPQKKQKSFTPLSQRPSSFANGLAPTSSSLLPPYAPESRTPTKKIGANSYVSWSSFPKPGMMNSSFLLTAST